MVKWIKKKIRKVQYCFRDLIINRKNRKRLKNKGFTIICNDCLGGVLYKDLRQQFNTPTINFFFSAEDYIKFLAKLEEYIQYGELRDITEKDSYIKVVIKIKDEQVVAHCLHYKTANEFIEKWNLRKARINLNNCFLMMNDRNNFREEHLKAFEKLPYKNKVCFVHKQYPQYKTAYYIKGSETEEMVKSLVEYKNSLGIRRYYDDFDFVEWFNTGNIMTEKH